jgi:hypothetical protein
VLAEIVWIMQVKDIVFRSVLGYPLQVFLAIIELLATDVKTSWVGL